MSIWELLQVVLTAFEIGMCIWLCDALVYNGEIVKRRKGYISGSILLLTMIVMGSRWDIFFSWPIFIFQISCIWLILSFRQKESKTLCFAVIFDYQLLITLIDLTLSFLAVSYLDDYFWGNLYLKVGGGRIFIYFLSRSVVFGMCLIFQICRKKYHFRIEDYKGVLFSIGVIGAIWGWLLLKTLVEHGNNSDLGDSFLIVSCLLILLMLMAIELRSTHIKGTAKMLQLKNDLLEQSYKDMQKLYVNNQYIFHDFKNHMILIKTYLDKKEYDKMSAYLNKIIEPIEKLSSYSHTGCEMLDLVLNIKRSEAEQKGIQYLVETDGRIHTNINENDLGNIFFNLLDNAIEACEKMENKDKWIRIAIKKKNQIHIMKIENSIEKPIVMKNGEYMTEKRDKEYHGIGMKSVESNVKQYGGKVNWSHTKDRFTVVITFFGNGL
jgi:hypothetical protein